MPLDICEGAQHVRPPRLRPLEQALAQPIDWPPSARLRAYGDLASLRGHAAVKLSGRSRSTTRSVRVGEALWLMAEVELNREEESR